MLPAKGPIAFRAGVVAISRCGDCVVSLDVVRYGPVLLNGRGFGRSLFERPRARFATGFRVLSKRLAFGVSFSVGSSVGLRPRFRA